jgi:phage tail sheath protein FI
MANYVSPGVYVIEKDISEYTPSINSSVVGIVGFASRGPTDKATLITSQNNLIDTFGDPSEGIYGQALEGALEILEQTNSLYFIRSASDSAAEASNTVQIGCGAGFIVSGTSSASTGQGFGVTSPLTLRIQITDADGNKVYTDNDNEGKDFTITAGTEPNSRNQARALRNTLGGALDSDDLYVEFDTDNGETSLSGIVITSLAGSAVTLEVTACSSTTYNEAAGVAALKEVSAAESGRTDWGVAGNFASSLTTYGATILPTGGSDSARYFVESLYPGEGYNGGLKEDGTSSGIAIEVVSQGGPKSSLRVNNNGTTSESFPVGLAGSGLFVESFINTGITNLKSNYIKGNIQYEEADTGGTANLPFYSTTKDILGDSDYNVCSLGGNAAAETNGIRFNKFVPQSSTNMTGGSNGIPASEADKATELIGTSTGSTKTGIQALDDSLLNISIALVPGVTNESVQNALITLAETTQNFIALVAPPYAVGGVQQAIDWTNGKASGRTGAINSSYAAVYWPWVKVFSTFDSKDRWYDPTIFAARQMAFTDSVSDVWFAPAGYQRGRLTKPSEVEVILNQGDRDSLYSGGNIINPITAFPQQGITIFGQRTGQRTPTALDRINIRRMMIYIRKVILTSTQTLIFEPNDEFTWARVENLLNPLLSDIKGRRGITEFRVVCDETTNTPVRVDRNEMWTKVIIKPTKTAEVIVFEINLTNQSADLGTI